MRSTTPPANPPTRLPIRILTHNIRYATQSPFAGELPWPARKPHLLAQLHYHTRHCPASLICLQEVLHAQLLDILASLTATESQWSYVGVGRDDGETAGEYSPIFYRRDVWKVERWFTTWLSPTPETPGSKGWDAASVRIVTVAVLRHRASRRTLLAMNTHLDDQGVVSRRESARLIVRTFKGVLAEADVGLEAGVEGGFLAGDLNSEVTGDAYRVLNEEGSGLVDLRRLVDSGYGDEMTYTGFDGRGDGDGKTTRIDFVHLSTDTASRHSRDGSEVQSGSLGGLTSTQWGVQGYAVLPSRFDDCVYISDHRAVVGDVVLMSKP